MIAKIPSNSDSTYAVRWLPSSAKFVVLGQHPKGNGLFQVYELDEQELILIKEVKTWSWFLILTSFSFIKMNCIIYEIAWNRRSAKVWNVWCIKPWDASFSNWRFWWTSCTLVIINIIWIIYKWKFKFTFFYSLIGILNILKHQCFPLKLIRVSLTTLTDAVDLLHLHTVHQN